MSKTYRVKTPQKSLQVGVNITPEIIINRETYDKIAHFVDQCLLSECQWFSTLNYLGTADGVCSYILDDIFIPHQQVNGTNVETSDHEMMQMWKEIQTLRNLTMEDLGTLMAQPLVWGHSHVNMPPDPSSTDDIKWKSMIEDANRLAAKGINKPTAMVIFNRRMEFSNRIYDPGLGIHWRDVNMYIAEDLDLAYVETALKTKIRELKVNTTPTATRIGGGTPLAVPHALTVNQTAQGQASTSATQSNTTPAKTGIPDGLALADEKTKILWHWGDKKK